MSVTCERPLDGVSAAHKLNSQSFDLVLVDCENLPAAKLIFDVCRRGKNGNNPVPIAIVDGRAGLPTAFRLGAELILTKPVAKDQARSTIRTAVSRVRKDAQTNESVPLQPASAPVPSPVITSAVMSEERAQAATASASSQLTSFADPAPSFVPSFVPSAAPSATLTATLRAPALTTKMHFALDEIDATPAAPKLNPQSGPFPASSLSESSSARAVPLDSKPARPVRLSDDPVLAELERAELEESEPKSSALDKPAPDPPSAESGARVSSSYPSSSWQGPQKRRGLLVALLVLALASAGFCAAWTYQPGFRAIAQPQIDRVLALVGMALPPTPAPSPAKASAQVARATAPAPAPESPKGPEQTSSQTQSRTAKSATSSVSATAPVQPTATSGTAVASPTAAPVLTKPDASKPSDSKKDASAATLSQLPGENSAIILSSKGAEKRLAYTVQPKYPVEARSGGAEGTVVLKAVVDQAGKVEGVRLVEGKAALATAAIQAVKQWRYRPYVRDGKTQPFQTVVIVDFQGP
jgi:protein TonB